MYGKLIRRYRISRRIKQFHLELDTDLPFGTISRIENGKINPTKETLFRIAIALQLSKDEIVDLFGINELSIK